MKDKIPPQATELEQSILGAVLLEKNVIEKIADWITPDSFYRQKHGTIYKACLELHQNNEPIDMLTVTNKLKSKGKIEEIGGNAAIVELTKAVGSSANLEYHAKIVKEKAILRQIIQIGGYLQKKGFSDEIDVFELLSEAEKKIYQTTAFVTGKEPGKIGEEIHETILEMQKMQHNEIVGVPSYLKDIDQTIGGYRPGDMNILAARPGQGKTAKALAEATNQAMNDIPVAYFSLEMNRRLLLKRIYANKGGIDTMKVNNSNLSNEDWQKVNETTSKIEDMPLFVDDEGQLTVMMLRSKLRKLVSKHGVRIAYIDYLQLMSAQKNHNNREGEISEISRGIKAIATELDIPIIALSQLNREVDKRTPPKPKLSDLRESGSLEQDASVVMFLYWPKGYGRQDDNDPDVAYNLIYKNRHGALREIPMIFEEEYGRFGDYIDKDYRQFYESQAKQSNNEESDEMPF